jgi:hypothetical protein
MFTQEQISTLFAFCEKHLVHHYDVQVELVDHLANAIEDRMQADKDLSFEAALIEVYAGFGVMGFSQMVKNRVLTLERQYSKQRLRLILAYFTWPKIGLTALVLALLFVTASYFSDVTRYYITVSIQSAAFIYELVAFLFLYRLRKKQLRKLTMTDTAMELPVIALPFIYYGTFWSRLFFQETTVLGQLQYVLMNGWAMLYVLVTFAYLHVAKKVFNDAAGLFPAAFVRN